MRVKDQPNGRALRGRRGFTTFYLSVSDQSAAALAWTAFNNRATGDGAVPAEPAAQDGACLYTRFLYLYS